MRMLAPYNRSEILSEDQIIEKIMEKVDRLIAERDDLADTVKNYQVRSLEDAATIGDLRLSLTALLGFIDQVGGYTTTQEQEIIAVARKVLNAT